MDNFSNVFPNLDGDSEGFPGYGRDVYKQIEGAFDYTLWREGATVTLLSVPWGVYSPDIMTDRPGFDTVEQRDEWFENRMAPEGMAATGKAESHVLNTRVRYQIDSAFELPFTFDYAARYNYLIVDYPDAPLPYGSNGIKRWFYHVTDISYNSPSSTSVTLVPDWWTTVAPLLTINHMILERGHAPVAETSVADYLSAPLDNSEYLLAPDEDYGGRARIASHGDVVLNTGDMYAIICTTGVPLSGDITAYTMPFDNSTFIDGIPSAWQIGVLATDLERLLDAWQAIAPQTMQSVNAIYFVSGNLVSFTEDGTCFEIPCKFSPYGTPHVIDTPITKELFGYDADIADLAKLYTSPYAHIELADERGNVTELRIEDLSTGKVSVEYALNSAYPWLKISAHALDVGGTRSTITFKNATSKEFSAGGRWYDTLREWDVPAFMIYQSAAQVYDYRTHYDRTQQAANIATDYANATAANNTGYTNADNSASNATANNAVQTAANSNVTSAQVSASASVNVTNGRKLATDVNTDNETSFSITGAKNDFAALATSVNNAATVQRSAVSAATNIVSGIGNAASGNVGGAINAAVSGLSTVADTAISVSAANASLQISQNSNTAMTTLTANAAATKGANAINSNTSINNTSNATATEITNIRNTAATSVTGNNVALMRKNAANTRDTGNANAGRSRDNATNAITNAVKSAAMGKPSAYGISRAGDFATTRPMMLTTSIVTESKSAIRQAATQFKRYGYSLNQAWRFETWNLMRNFTYWQVSDIWATGVDTVPEEGQDAVRRMLYSGVTVWRDPDKIGTVSIYDN